MSGPSIDHDDNPEWTARDFTDARPATEVLSAEAVRALVDAPPSAPERGERVTLWLDDDVIARFRAAGDDWEARINAALRDADPWAVHLPEERDAA